MLNLKEVLLLNQYHYTMYKPKKVHPPLPSPSLPNGRMIVYAPNAKFPFFLS